MGQEIVVFNALDIRFRKDPHHYCRSECAVARGQFISSGRCISMAQNAEAVGSQYLYDLLGNVVCSTIQYTWVGMSGTVTVHWNEGLRRVRRIKYCHYVKRASGRDLNVSTSDCSLEEELNDKCNKVTTHPCKKRTTDHAELCSAL